MTFLLSSANTPIPSNLAYSQRVCVLWVTSLFEWDAHTKQVVRVLLMRGLCQYCTLQAKGLHMMNLARGVPVPFWQHFLISVSNWDGQDCSSKVAWSGLVG